MVLEWNFVLMHPYESPIIQYPDTAFTHRDQMYAHRPLHQEHLQHLSRYKARGFVSEWVNVCAVGTIFFLVFNSDVPGTNHFSTTNTIQQKLEEFNMTAKKHVVDKTQCYLIPLGHSVCVHSSLLHMDPHKHQP